MDISNLHSVTGFKMDESMERTTDTYIIRTRLYVSIKVEGIGRIVRSSSKNWNWTYCQIISSLIYLKGG